MSNIIREKFSERLKFARERRKLKQSDVAHALGMTPQNYSRIESGKQSMPYEKLAEVSSLLDTSADELLSVKAGSALLSEEEVLLLCYYKALLPELQHSTGKLIRALYVTQPSPDYLDIITKLLYQPSQPVSK